MRIELRYVLTRLVHHCLIHRHTGRLHPVAREVAGECFTGRADLVFPAPGARGVLRLPYGRRGSFPGNGLEKISGRRSFIQCRRISLSVPFPAVSEMAAAESRRYGKHEVGHCFQYGSQLHDQYELAVLLRRRAGGHQLLCADDRAGRAELRQRRHGDCRHGRPDPRPEEEMCFHPGQFLGGPDAEHLVFPYSHFRRRCAPAGIPGGGAVL